MKEVFFVFCCLLFALTTSAQIRNSDKIDIEVADATRGGGCLNGSISATFTGGNPPFTISLFKVERILTPNPPPPILIEVIVANDYGPTVVFDGLEDGTYFIEGAGYYCSEFGAYTKVECVCDEGLDCITGTRCTVK
ncbi:MAG: hypothetical protein AB8F78_15330 [Saprospiraceae bacterium]